MTTGRHYAATVLAGHYCFEPRLYKRAYTTLERDRLMEIYAADQCPTHRGKNWNAISRQLNSEFNRNRSGTGCCQEVNKLIKDRRLAMMEGAK